MAGPGAEAVLESGRVVAGRYRIRALLGHGGMGAVYEAEHVTLRRVVALKVLLPALANDAEVIARFLREARAAAGVGHPGIVEVFDLGSDDGLTFLAMEKLEGEELAARIRREPPLSFEAIARLGADLAEAISAAHQKGIVHRDLKPQNVFLARRGRQGEVVKVLDFGIAKLVEKDDASTALTRTGQVFGTPMYMAPEQLRGSKAVDGRADVYAIGVILFEAITGRAPFVADTYAELVLRICSDQVPRLGALRPGVPDALATIVERAMSRDVASRFQSAQELAAALERLAREPSVRSAIPARPDALASTVPSAPMPAPAGPPAIERPDTPFVSVSQPAPEPARSRWSARAWIGVAAVGLVGTIGAVAALEGSVAPEPPETPADVPPDPAARPPVTVVAPEDRAPPTPPPGIAGTAPDLAVSPEPPAGPATRRLAFDIGPPGAEVVVNGRLVCEAPCSADVEDVASTISVSHPGYRSEERALAAPLPERVSIQLLRARLRGGSARAAEPPALRER